MKQDTYFPGAAIITMIVCVCVSGILGIVIVNYLGYGNLADTIPSFIGGLAGSLVGFLISHLIITWRGWFDHSHGNLESS